jgi:hypothetical protein
MPATAVFTDTSIHIARSFKSAALREKIEQRLSSFDLVITGLAVRAEYRRRVLGEAKYLLRLLNEYNSAKRVQHHIVDELGGGKNQRKRTISLELLTTFYPKENDAAHSERLKSLLRSLLVGGLSDFDDSVDCVLTESGCGAGKQNIKEIVPYKKYDIGPTSCSELRGSCGIELFIANKRELLERISAYLQNLSAETKTQELISAEKVLTRILSGENPSTLNLCKTVGDLVIALESASIGTVYTQNIKESRHLCRSLGQTVIYRNNHPEEQETVYAPE